MNLRTVTSFASGILFAVGLALSGMTHPEKVIGFLDFFGDWEADLLFVIGGAVATLGLARIATRKLRRPIAADVFHGPSKSELDRKLLVGASIFGAGWGLIGLCPGPALVSLSTLEPSIFLFVGAMSAGMLAHSVVQRSFAT